MLCRGANDATLKPERFHGCGIAVLVFVKLGAPHHIVR